MSIFLHIKILRTDKTGKAKIKKPSEYLIISGLLSQKYPRSRQNEHSNKIIGIDHITCLTKGPISAICLKIWG